MYGVHFPSMRKMLALFLSILLLALLAAAAFFLVSQPPALPKPPALQELPALPEESSSSAAQEKETAPATIPGWCCRRDSAVCARAAGAALCLRTGGRAFDVREERCNAICAILSR